MDRLVLVQHGDVAFDPACPGVGALRLLDAVQHGEPVGPVEGGEEFWLL
jgi:hypothetical protein